MPRRTKKYMGALEVYNFRNLPPNEINVGNHEELYQFLQANGFFWNSDRKIWEEHDIADADEPTQLILVRVWADADIVEEAADEICTKTKRHFKLIDRSRPYPCRPPKQREARIYLKFLPRRKP